MDALKSTPPQVTEQLMQWGGKTMYGDPAWRIVLAENRLALRAGVWTEFSLDAEQSRPTGTDWQMETQSIAPESIKVGTFWVPMYPCRGWILERWFPPSAFGTKEAWESTLSQDNETPMMGPYPSRGDYWMLDGPWDEIPPLELIRVPISQWENDPQNTRGVVDEEKVLKCIHDAQNAAQEKEERDYERILADMTYATEHNLGMIKGTPGLSAMRNKIAKQNGFTSHI